MKRATRLTNSIIRKISLKIFGEIENSITSSIVDILGVQELMRDQGVSSLCHSKCSRRTSVLSEFDLFGLILTGNLSEIKDFSSASGCRFFKDGECALYKNSMLAPEYCIKRFIKENDIDKGLVRTIMKNVARPYSYVKCQLRLLGGMA